MDSTNFNVTDIDFLRILWCDNANIIRSKAIYLNSDEQTSLKVTISSAQQGVPVMYDGVIPDSGLSPVGEIDLEADFSTFSKIPYAPGHGKVMGNMKINGKSWNCCPRYFLEKNIAKLSEMNLNLKASFENEFYLLKGDSEEIISADNTPFASNFSMDINYDFIRDLTNALTLQDIKVKQYYPEAGFGQQEITIKYEEALKAADNQITFRETVKAIAYQHSLKSSFLPKIFPEGAGNGCHLHLSLWKGGKNILGESNDPYGLSPTGKQFLAGILEHLPALMALIAPSINSYRRILPHSWSGAYNCWGIDNREAAIRVISHIPGVQHFELKTVDASSNPYIALGAVIAAGCDGIDQALELKEPIQEDPGNMSLDDLKRTETELLPQSLEKSIVCLEKDDLLINALGPQLSKAYIAVKKAEMEFFKDLSMEEEIAILLEKY
jgi:glutamine synthetase